MKELGFIRDYFRPIQPTVSPNDNLVSYLEVAPSIELSSFIYCYWQLKTTKDLQNNFNYRVVSDGCIDILWEKNTPQDIFITGFSNKYIEFPLLNSFHYLGIRFLPTALPLLFNISAKELTNQFLRLVEVLPNLYERVAQLNVKESDLNRLAILLNSYFSTVLLETQFSFDRRLFNALYEILKAQGTLNISRDLDTGISQRQLRRMFDFYIGDSPKTFSKVVRFQNILMSKPSVQSLKQNRLFYDLGYFDQAHFIKDFKYMYGVTPTIAFK